MASELEGKVIAVVGASSGVGEGIARAIAEYSPKGIILAARSVEKLEKIAGDIKGVDTLVVGMDVNQQGSFDELISQGVSKYGTLDVIVNSAGIIQGEKKDEDLSPVERKAIWLTNYIQVLESKGPIMKCFLEQKKGIYIVISSHAASKNFPFQAYYNSSKSGASSVALSMDNEFLQYRREGCDVWAFALEPGFINTTKARSQFRSEEFKEMLDKSPSPEEFGKILVSFMINPEAKYNERGARHIIETV